ncbi:hypothetical protein [Sunxiuqinia indica]|uniref:hypothetical protein n=1 Tax=Sunxiuqinia indica TaxID=2692584 RepID=UPI001358DCA2|nr:hypothetical protein [Sunxiuqinia indica]
MKKYLIFLLFVGICQFSLAQQPYKYVIIPTLFPDFTEGFNPYGLSTSLQKELNAKSIETVFQSDEVPANYCDAVTAGLVKLKSTFRNKLTVELKDCRNRVIWSQEGTGRSKDFREGYGEAIADALKNLNELPINQNPSAAEKGVTTKPTENEDNPLPAITDKPQQKAEVEIAEVAGGQKSIYKPENLFYNYSYFVDFVAKGNGKKELVIVNGELLGYQNLQVIATLIPSGLDQVFTVNWINTDGTTVRGVANLTSEELNVSLPNGDEMEVIQLRKY